MNNNDIYDKKNARLMFQRSKFNTKYGNNFIFNIWRWINILKITKFADLFLHPENKFIKYWDILLVLYNNDKLNFIIPIILFN